MSNDFRQSEANLSMIPPIPTGLINQLSVWTADYIKDGSDKYYDRATPLSSDVKRQMFNFFSIAVMENARLLVIPSDETVENPKFYPMLRSMGFANLPDMSAMSAITFFKTIVFRVDLDMELLFHELVHAEQYQQLGIDRFSRLYVTGFLNGGSYGAIPLENQAYDLTSRFQSTPNLRFSVSDLVADCIATGRF